MLDTGAVGRPWLSVITVVRDDDLGLTRTISSLQRQSFDGVEFIVVDGSSDRERVKNCLVDAGIKSRYSWDEPRGIYPAMNRGLEVATGKFTYFANAGDELFAGDVFSRTREFVSESDWAFVNFMTSCRINSCKSSLQE